MYRCKMNPYEGNSPYIFISYAHKDSDQVLPILDELAGRGYRIWYDDGIAPGSEWPEYIAVHLTNSSLVLAFISPNSIASPNCRREVTFALAQNKPFVGIYLCETQMSPGMEMQLSAQQCIMKYAMPDESFYSKLCGIAEIIPCRVGDAKPNDAPAAIPGDKPAAPPEDAPKSPPAITPEDMDALDDMRDAADSARRRKKKEKKSNNESVKKRKAKMLPLAAAVVIAAVILLKLLSGGGSVKINDKKYDRNIYSILLEDQQLDAADIQTLAKLKKLAAIRMVNCQVTGDLSSLKSLPTLSTFDAEDSSFSSLAFLDKAVNLGSLRLSNCSADSLPDLNGMTMLQNLDLNGCSGFSDLSKLPLSQIIYLSLAGTSVSDFSPIASAENLRTLDISSTRITDASQPMLSLKLKELTIDSLALTSAAGFDSLTVLEKFSARDCGLTEIPLLAKNAATLKELDLSGNHPDSASIAALAECAGLTSLCVDGIPLESLDIVSSMADLKKLSACRCGLTDISALNGCAALTELCLSDNRLTELSLSAVTGLKFIDLSRNALSDISGLPGSGHDTLVLLGNPIDPDTIPAFESQCAAIVIDYADGLENVDLKKWNYVFLAGSPLDKQLLMEEAASLKVLFIDGDAVIKAIDDCFRETGYRSYYSWYQYLNE